MDPSHTSPKAARTTLQQMWQTRPPRIPEDQGSNAVIAGVCAGIGARYQIDPTFIRVFFIGLSLIFGGGIFAYLLCWMCMPRFGMTLSPGKAIIIPSTELSAAERKERTTGWGLVIGLILFVPSVSAIGDLRAVLVTTIVCLGAWFLAHRRMPLPPAGLLAGKTSPPPSPA